MRKIYLLPLVVLMLGCLATVPPLEGNGPYQSIDWSELPLSVKAGISEIDLQLDIDRIQKHENGIFEIYTEDGIIFRFDSNGRQLLDGII